MCGASAHVSLTPSLFIRRRPFDYIATESQFFPLHVTVLSHTPRYHGPMMLGSMGRAG
jgi:hypothetical protein